MYGDNYSPAVFADELTDTDIDKAIELLQLMKEKGYTRIVSHNGRNDKYIDLYSEAPEVLLRCHSGDAVILGCISVNFRL